MDTKLKNRRKLGLFLAAVTILGAAFFMIYNYHTIYRKAVSEAQKLYNFTFRQGISGKLSGIQLCPL